MLLAKSIRDPRRYKEFQKVTPSKNLLNIDSDDAVNAYLRVKNLDDSRIY